MIWVTAYAENDMEKQFASFYDEAVNEKYTRAILEMARFGEDRHCTNTHQSTPCTVRNKNVRRKHRR